MIVKLLTEHYLDLLSLKGGCRGSFESTHVKMSHCWKSHVTAQLCRDILPYKYTDQSLVTYKLISPLDFRLECNIFFDIAEVTELINGPKCNN